MGEIPPTSSLPPEPNRTPTSAPRFVWTAEGDGPSHWLAATASFSYNDTGITLDDTPTATPPIPYRTDWRDSSLAGALGRVIRRHSSHLPITPLGPIHPLNVQNTTPTPPAEASPSPTSTPTCKIVTDTPCTQLLYGTSWSIRWHLRMHGHKHPRREAVQCPWAGCPDTLRWMNIPRHIRSVHLGIRLVCPTCERAFTRSLGLARHIASKKCSPVVTPPT